MQRVVVPIEMSGGVDLRLNKRQVSPPKCLALQNARFAAPGTFSKRYGGTIVGTLADTGAGFSANKFSALSGTSRDQYFWGQETGTLSSAGEGHSLFSAGDRLFTFNRDRLLSHNEATDVWTQHAMAPLVDATVTPPMTPASTPTRENCDIVRTSDGLLCVVGGKYGTGITVTISDEITGDSYYFTRTNANAGKALATKIGNTILVFWAEGAAPKSLYLKTFTRTALPTLATNALDTPTATVLAADLLDIGSHKTAWDVIEYDGTNCLLAHVKTGTGDVHYGYCDVTGTRTSTGSIVTTNDPYAVQVCLNTALSRWAVMFIEGTTHTVKARIYDTAMVAVTALTTIQAVGAAVFNLTCAFKDATTVAMLWWFLSSGDLLTRYGTINTAATVTTSDYAFHCHFASRLWLISNDLYCAFWPATTYRGLFIVRIGDPALASPGSNQRVVVAHLLPGEAIPVTSHFDPHIVVNGSSEYLLPTTVLPTSGDEDNDYTVRVVKLKKASRANAVVLGDVAYIPSGITWRVDANGAYEAGFLVPGPMDVDFTYAGGGSLPVSTSFQYRLFWEWINDKGELEQSAGSDFTATTGGADSQVIMSIATMPFTNRTAKLGLREIGIGVYRLDAGASSYRRVSKRRITADSNVNGYTLNAPDQARVSFSDTDASIGDRATDYISDGESQHVAPMACKVATVTNGRVFLSGFGHNADLIWFSKMKIIDVPTSFSDENTILVQGGTGTITALAPLGDALLVFRSSQVLVLGGDGPNNTGLSGGFSDARILSDEVGCENLASIVHGPGGTYFQATNGGIYKVGTNEAIEYVGSDVQAKSALASVTSAVVVQRDREIRFTIPTADGFTQVLVYHYDIGAWSTRNFPSQYGACLWRGTWTGLGGVLGEVYKEVVDQFHDNSTAYNLVYESAWMRPNVLIQGANRVYRILAMGDGLDVDSKAVVKLYYDYDDAVAATLSMLTIPGSGSLQFEARPSRQQVQAMKVRIEDGSDGVDPLRDSFSLSELAFELATYGTPVHLPATKRAT